MRSDCSGTLDLAFRTKLRVITVLVHQPSEPTILERHSQNFPQTLARRARRHRGGDFHAPREVAIHPVAGADEEVAVGRLGATRCEMEDSRVLEEPADDRAYPDRRAVALDARTEATEAADDQIDRHPGTGRVAQCGDDCGVLELIHLCADSIRQPAVASGDFSGY